MTEQQLSDSPIRILIDLTAGGPEESDWLRNAAKGIPHSEELEDVSEEEIDAEENDDGDDG